MLLPDFVTLFRLTSTIPPLCTLSNVSKRLRCRREPGHRRDGDPPRRPEQQRRLGERLPPAGLGDPERPVPACIRFGGGLGGGRPRPLLELGRPDPDPPDV